MYSVEITKTGGFRPLSGSFFLYLKFYDKNKDNLTDKNVSVPYRGLSFYLLQTTSIDTAYNVSVPYRGLFFYIDLTRTQTSASTRFRPLSGSFFLSLNIPMDETTVVGFPSPIGVFIFIYKTYDSKKKLLAEFPSPIGVFLFIYITVEELFRSFCLFPSPIGVFLFILMLAFDSLIFLSNMFPSPIGVFLFISCPLYPSVYNT